MNTEKFYRFECDGVGIYEAVDLACPRDDKKRDVKPDGSWLPKIGAKFPGAVSYWTSVGLRKYSESKLRDWHLFTVGKTSDFIIATKKTDRVLYEDEFQIIVEPSVMEIKRKYALLYEGPTHSFVPHADLRPNFIRHHDYLRDWCSYGYYKSSRETFTLGASLGESLGLVRTGIHHEILPPGRRSSWPHAHSSEEELAIILKGEAEIWANGVVYRASAGEAIYFPPNSGLAHTIMNNSGEDVEMMVFGEQGNKDDLIFYPHHEERNKECSENGRLWKDYPLTVNWADDGSVQTKRELSPVPYPHSVKWSELEAKPIGEKGASNKIFYQQRDIARHLGATRVALHVMILPPRMRSSYAHAESHEEEFLYVLKGNPSVWINGKVYDLREGDAVAFPSGTGIAHTFLNRTDEEVVFIVSGEMTNNNNLCAFPINPELKESCAIWWEDYPRHQLGTASDMP